MVLTADPRLLCRDHILRPWIVGEAISTVEAVTVAVVSEDTIRRWCSLHGIGRRHSAGRRWFVSRPMLDMFLVEDRAAMAAYLNGERGGLVAPYFERVGVILPGANENKSPRIAA